MRDHTKLKAFQLANEMALQVYRSTASFPRSEMFGLTAQMRRAAVSVPSNIVEGCARPSQTEYVRFLGMAFGSAKEVQYQAFLAGQLGLLKESEQAKLDAACEGAVKTLGALIRSLRNRASAPAS